MYWTDWGTPATIESATMDGGDRKVLHSTNLVWPNALTIDYATQTLYWMDADLNRLESSKTDGSGRTLLSTNGIYQPFSITFYEGDLFWSDWAINGILTASLSDPSIVQVVIGNLTARPSGVTPVCLGENSDGKIGIKLNT